MDLEAEYNNRARIPEHVDILARWYAASAAARGDGALDRPYGPGDRHRYDLFAAGPGAPLAVVIHGGYWQLGGREMLTFVAPGLTRAGIAVALPSYSLCPAVGVLEIVEELRTCVAALGRATGRRVVVVGHSAGAHLAAAVLATDWAARGEPAELVPAAVAISGVYDLAPLVTTTINAALGLDPASARAASPRYWAAPAGRTLVTAVGSDETSEFVRQTHSLAEAWGVAGVATEVLTVRGANHFTIVDELTRPDSALFARTVALIDTALR